MIDRPTERSEGERQRPTGGRGRRDRREERPTGGRGRRDRREERPTEVRWEGGGERSRKMKEKSDFLKRK